MGLSRNTLYTTGRCHAAMESTLQALELLLELQELTSSRSGDTGDPFTSFIDTRQNAGRPVTLHHGQSNALGMHVNISALNVASGSDLSIFHPSVTPAEGVYN